MKLFRLIDPAADFVAKAFLLGTAAFAGVLIAYTVKLAVSSSSNPHASGFALLVAGGLAFLTSSIGSVACYFGRVRQSHDWRFSQIAVIANYAAFIVSAVTAVVVFLSASST